jgi:hypothetical protein
MSSLGDIDGVGDGVERVDVAPFSSKGLDRASNGGVSDVGGAEVVHVAWYKYKVPSLDES